MASGPWKVSFAISQSSSIDFGWTCNFWNDITTIATVKTNAIALKNALLALMGRQAVCKYIRIADTLVKRAVYSDGFDGTAEAVTTTNDTDFPTTAALLYLNASDTEYTHQWIRGLRDSVVHNVGKLDVAHGDWSNEITAFKNILTTTSLGWKIRQMDITLPEQSIKTIDVLTGIVTFKANHPWALNSVLKVRIKGVKLPKKYNGIHEVTAHAQDAITLSPIPDKGTLTAATFKSASAREVKWSYKAITQVWFERSTSHKTGRPTRVGSGRRKTR